MNEKRFRIGKGIFEEGYPSESIIDTKTGKVYYKGYANYASSKEICDLLNQKEKRIEELEHQLHSLTGLWASDKEDMSYPFRLEFKECENNE